MEKSRAKKIWMSECVRGIHVVCVGKLSPSQHIRPYLNDEISFVQLHNESITCHTRHNNADTRSINPTSMMEKCLLQFGIRLIWNNRTPSLSVIAWLLSQTQHRIHSRTWIVIVHVEWESFCFFFFSVSILPVSNIGALDTLLVREIITASNILDLMSGWDCVMFDNTLGPDHLQVFTTHP